MKQLNRFFLGIWPQKYSCKKPHKTVGQNDYFVGRNLSLVGCSSAEPTSVLVSICKNLTEKLYLQTAKFYNHFPYPPCIQPEYWPKVYTPVKAIQSITKDNFGNIFAVFHEPGPNNISYNHVGVSLNFSNLSEQLIHYNSIGSSNWSIDQWESYSCVPLYNGTIQMGSTNSFFNTTTGTIASPPAYFVNGETIIAQMTNGALITNIGNAYFIRSGFGFSNITSGTSYWYASKFNSISNKIYFTTSSGFVIYSISNNSFVNPPIIIPISSPYELIQVTTDDKIFVLKNGILYEINYSVPSNPQFNIVNVNNFINNNLKSCNNGFIYSEDKFLVFNQNNSNLYSLDFSSTVPTSKSLPCTNNFGWGNNFCYTYVNNNIYLSGWHNASFTLGSQYIPFITNPLFPNVHNVFLTKLNLQTDFNRYSDSVLSANNIFDTKESILKIDIIPNPIIGFASFKIISSGEINNQVCQLFISDKMGIPVLNKKDYRSGANIYLGNLPSGVYFAKIIDNEGLSKTISFFKQ